jgi:putative salt-induced outer membrane protein YdiY
MMTVRTTSRLLAAATLLAWAVAAQAQTSTTTNRTTITNQNTIVTTTTVITKTTNNAATGRPIVHVPTYPWKSTITLGVTLARGNTDTTLASASFITEKKWPLNDLVFGGDGLYGETKNPGQQQYTESAEVLHGYSQYNRTITDGLYGYGRIDGFHDGIADIKYRVTLAPGIGYFFITNKITDLSAEIGPGYIREQLGGDTESFATLRIGEKFHYAISAHAKAWESIEYLPQVDRFNNYIVNAELGIEAALNKSNNLSLRSVLDDCYNNIPAANRLKNDLKLITSLVYKF